MLLLLLLLLLWSVSTIGVSVNLKRLRDIEAYCIVVPKPYPYPNVVSTISVLSNIFVIRLTLQWSVQSLLFLSLLGWTMQILSYTASPQSTSHFTHNTLARLVVGNRTSCSNMATLSQLHWLPVHDRIKFKIAIITHKAIYTGNPPPMWLIWSSGTIHTELYGLPLPTFSLLLFVTSHLVLEVFTRQLLLYHME